MLHFFGSAQNGQIPTDFYVSLQLLLLLPPSRHQLLKLMATRWHLIAVDATVSLRIDSNTVKE